MLEESYSFNFEELGAAFFHCRICAAAATSKQASKVKDDPDHLMMRNLTDGWIRR